MLQLLYTVAGIAVLLQNSQSDVFDTQPIVHHAVAAAHSRTVYTTLEIACGSLATSPYMDYKSFTCAARWAESHSIHVDTLAAAAHSSANHSSSRTH
eukprot:13431-Heterococcus_DN1.PRE.2